MNRRSILILACVKITNFGFNAVPLAIFNAANDYYGPYKDANCIDSAPLHPVSIKNCALGDRNQGEVNVLVIGDSHAFSDAGFMNILLSNAHLKGYLIAQEGTPFILGNIRDWRENHPMQRNSVLNKIIHEKHYPYVVLGGFWNYYSDQKLLNDNKANTQSYAILEKGLDNALASIVQAGSTPVLILDTPPLLRVQRFCGKTPLFKLFTCYNDSQEIERVQATTRSILLSMRSKYPSVIFIDPSPVICKHDRCVASLQGLPIYSTGELNSHMNYPGSTVVGQHYLQQFKNPFV